MNAANPAALFVGLVRLADQIGKAITLEDHDEIGSTELKITQLLTFVKRLAHSSRYDYRGNHPHSNRDTGY